MPGVKGLHQESAGVSKPEWIRGHYFSALGLLLGGETALFAVPEPPRSSRLVSARLEYVK